MEGRPNEYGATRAPCWKAARGGVSFIRVGIRNTTSIAAAGKQERVLFVQLQMRSNRVWRKNNTIGT